MTFVFLSLLREIKKKDRKLFFFIEVDNSTLKFINVLSLIFKLYDIKHDAYSKY